MRILTTLLLVYISSSTIYSQNFLEDNKSKKITNIRQVHFAEKDQDVPMFLELNSELPVNKFASWMKESIDLEDSYSFVSNKVTKDKLGQSHYKYQQMYKGLPIENHVAILHGVNGKFISFNGNIVKTVGKINTNPALDEKEALAKALKHVSARLYQWQSENPMDRDSLAKFFPKGEKVILETKEGSKIYKLAYKFDVYAIKPLSRSYIYIDAGTGEVLKSISRICDLKHVRNANHIVCNHNHVQDKVELEQAQEDIVTTANTYYSGEQTITTESFDGGFRLRESGRNIETYSLNSGFDYSVATDVVSQDNVWDQTGNFVNAAYDAHWGAEVTYDYFYSTFNRNSFDGEGAPMLSYVHYGEDYDNAFWDGERMTYGDGSNSSGGFTPLTSVDVVGHEFTHGLTEYLANLIYEGESGALNEAFSDMFGTVIEFEAKPNVANFDMGDKINFDGGALRSLSDPKSYQNPNTYGGEYWDVNQGVHTNSGIGGYWFYLLCEGGSGINDLDSVFDVKAIGMDNAAQVAYRTLSVYLTPTSNYTDARYYSIKSAVDLFGACTAEVEAVTNAWYAVGVGESYSPIAIADFIVGDTLYCAAPAIINFRNVSSNASSYNWDFGDGSSASLEESPIHSYTEYGTYNVTLGVDGGDCGTDQITKSSYIKVDSTAICLTKVPFDGVGAIQYNCEGKLYDDGGLGGNYANNSRGIITISPDGAASVVLKFNQFNYETGYDYINIYDGPSVTSELIGSYTGANLPEEGNNIFSTNGVMTIEQSSDQALTDLGFDAEWFCLDSTSGPVVDFETDNETTCTGEIQFVDKTINNPISWEWDFGDGTTSLDQSPLKTYTQDGLYTISLISCNSQECDTLILTDYITVDLSGLCPIRVPESGSAPLQTECFGYIQDDGGEEDYSSSTNGSVTISVDTNAHIVLDFTAFSMENQYDYLYIYDGETTADRLIGAFTGSDLPSGGTVFSTGNTITLYQISDGSVNNSGFNCSWRCDTSAIVIDTSDVLIPSVGERVITDCEGTLKDDGGDYDYTNNSTGVVTISPDSATSITLHFSRFDYEYDYDYLNIYASDDLSSPIGAFTGTALPLGGTVFVSNGSVTIEQVTDGSEVYPGFEANWTCSTEELIDDGSVVIPVNGSGAIQTDCEGIIKDNGGDFDYSSNSDGSITISPDSATSITLTFNSFDYELDYDYLYVYEGETTSGNLLDRFSGSTIPNVTTYSGSSITLSQYSDGSVNGSGFEATWACSKEIDTTIVVNEDVVIPFSGIGEVQTACTGVVKDDGADSNYSNNSDGSITISPASATSITLTFTSFDYELDFDYLYVYEGETTSGNLLESFSGSTVPGMRTYSGNSITLRQYSDGSVDGAGFEATWTCSIEDDLEEDESVLLPSVGEGVLQTSCLGVIKDDGGDFNYSTNSQGSITISPDSAIQLSLEFSSFDLEDGADYLYVYDGQDITSNLLGQFTGSDIPSAIISTGNAITLLHVADGNVVTGTGFEASWQCNTIDGIEDFGLTRINIYPNPAKDYLNIDVLNFNGKMTLTFWDVLHEKVKEVEINTEISQVDLSGLKTGMYIIYNNLDNQVHKIFID